MIYNYKDCINKYKSHSGILKEINSKRLFKIGKGIYSTKENLNSKDLAVFIKKYNNPIFTMESALFYWGIVDEIPEKEYIASDKDAYKIKDKNIKQYFDNKGLINLGVTTTTYNGVKIRLYNKERMLLEVIRYRNKLPYDFYKEVVYYYRDNINEIDISLMEEYLESFPKKEFISNILDMEIF